MTPDDYSARLRFEHELISRRVGWLLTSQGLLFAAYGVTLGKQEPAALQFRMTLPVLGTALALAVLCGVLASFFAKLRTWQDFRRSGHPNEPFWVRTWITYLGFVPDFVLPLAFAAAWLVVLAWFVDPALPATPVAPPRLPHG